MEPWIIFFVTALGVGVYYWPSMQIWMGKLVLTPEELVRRKVAVSEQFMLATGLLLAVVLFLSFFPTVFKDKVNHWLALSFVQVVVWTIVRSAVAGVTFNQPER